MNSARTAAWLGYHATGGSLEIDPKLFLQGGAVLGRGAKDLVSSLVYCLNETSTKICLVDLDGDISKALSGYIDTYDAGYVLHDSLVMGENAQFHALLISSAYSTVLDMPVEQEALLNSVVQALALETGEASPMAIAPLISSAEGFKGPDKNEVQGRLATLRLLDSAGDIGAVAQVVGSSCIVDFSKARHGELAEASAALFMAKMLSLPEGKAKPEVLFVTEAQRVFKAFRIPRHKSTLRSALLSSPFGVVFSSSVGHALDRNIVDACATQFYSSEIWNALNLGQKTLPNMFVMQDHTRGTVTPFVPREFEPLNGERKIGGELAPSDKGLALKILQIVSASDSATKTSMVSWLSSEYPPTEVAKEIGALQAEGSIVFMKPAQGTDSPSTVLRLTEIGKLNLREMMEHGETSDRV